MDVTKRELQVLRLISEGFSTKEIANSLFVSPETIKTNRSSLLRKFSAKNSSHLITKAIRIKVIG